MARRCTLTGKGVLTGNNVSHANNKTRRRYLPNLQSRRLFSETLGETVRLRIAASTLRTIEKQGGIDGFLLLASSLELPGELVRLKRRIAEQQAKRAAGIARRLRAASAGRAAASAAAARNCRRSRPPADGPGAVRGRGQALVVLAELSIPR